MASQRANRLAVKYQKTLDRVTKKGVINSNRLSVALFKELIALFKQDNFTFEPVINRYSNAFTAQVEIGAMIAHLIGMKMFQQEAAKHNKKRIFLSEETDKELRKLIGPNVHPTDLVNKAAIQPSSELFSGLADGLDISSLERQRIANRYATTARTAGKNFTKRLNSRLTTSMVDIISLELSEAQALIKIKEAFELAGVTAKHDFWYATIYRTETQIAMAGGRWQSASDPILGELLWGFEYVTMHDQKVRPLHVEADGTVLPKDDLWWDINFPPCGYNCFVPDTKVSGDFCIGTRALYTGDVIKIETAMGGSLTITPNHKIATLRGWVKAKELTEGDCCFSNGSVIEVDNLPSLPITPTSAKYPKNIPSFRIDDIFHSLLPHGSAFGKVSLLEFDGDAACFEGNIDIVAADIELMNKILAAQLSQSLGKRNLSKSNIALIPKETCGLLATLLVRALTSSNRLPGPTALPDSLFSSHLAPFKFLSLGTASGSNAIASEETRNCPTAYAKFLAELQNCGSFNVLPDNIVRITRFPFSGHVYDLQSFTHTILANGIVASNCRCQAIEIFEEEPIKRSDAINVNDNPNFENNWKASPVLEGI